jgi:hypothetical protein
LQQKKPQAEQQEQTQVRQQEKLQAEEQEQAQVLKLEKPQAEQQEQAQVLQEKTTIGGAGGATNIAKV